MLENGDRDRFHAGRGVVLFREAGEHALQPKVHVALGGEAGVRGPHTGKRLANAAYGAFHRAAADGAPAGVDDAGPISMGKDLEERDRVFDCLKGRIEG